MRDPGVKPPSRPHGVVRFAVAASRALLRVFPGRFRQRHADPLVQNLTDVLSAEHRRSGTLGVVWLWPRLARDLLSNGLAERARGRPPIPISERLPMFDALLLDHMNQMHNYRPHEHIFF